MKTSILTYNQIINVLKTFAEDHYQINYFGNGDFWEIIENEDFDYTNYPVMFVIDQPVSHGTRDLTYNFQIALLDIQHDKDGEGYENEIKSDMLQVYLDLLAYMEICPQLKGDNISVTVTSGSSTSVTEETGDNLTGWLNDISIQIPINRNKCAIPKT